MAGRGELPVAPRTTDITLEVILRTVIGASDPVRLAALRKVVPRLLYMKPWETPAITNPEPAALLAMESGRASDGRDRRPALRGDCRTSC